MAGSIFIPLDFSQSLFDENGKATAYFEDWITRAFPLYGEGDPNGVVYATRYRFYVQTDAAPASGVLWVKMTDETDNTGWEKA